MWRCALVQQKIHVVTLHYLRQSNLVLGGFAGVGEWIILEWIFKK